MSEQSVASLSSEIAYGVELDLPIAGLGGRAYAFLIDWHIRLLIALAWVLLGLFVILPIMSPEGYLYWQNGDSSLVNFVVGLPAMAIYFLYHPVMEVVTGGSSPGKRMAGVRIVNSKGHRPDVSAILIRNLFRLIDSLPAFYVVGMVATIISDQKLRIGDMAAQTVLVYEDKVASADLKRAVQIQGAGRGDMTEDQIEILNELLSRWDELRRDVRCQYAAKLLVKLGLDVPREKNAKQRDLSLYDKLQSIAQK